MVSSTTPTIVCGCLAVPGRPGPKGSVAVPLSPFGPRRPAAAMHAQPPARAVEPTI
jgi:hypothetical protein